ncbi:MAG: glycosyltransferase, partial [Hyphomicrobiaceae bacterium]|nr:glycosyltransferase [Hyphomicrobiaceae bacterium]
MRITFILPFAGLSGGIRVIAIYAQKLRARGHEVFIVSQPAEQQPLRRKIKGLLLGQPWPVGEQAGPFAGLNDHHHTILEKPRAVQEGDVPDADIIIATFWKTAYWVNKLPASKGAKCYFIQGHEIQPHFYESTAEETYRFPLHQITVSSWLKNIMKEEYGANEGDLVPNAVDLQTFTSPSRQKNQTLTVGFIFAPASTKNSELAIEALARV